MEKSVRQESRTAHLSGLVFPPRLLRRYDFRYYKNPTVLTEPLQPTDSRLDALLASTAEYLCDELGLEPPGWLATVPACQTPWFVSDMENLKAIALAESPLRFRIRKIFVLENFLSRA